MERLEGALIAARGIHKHYGGVTALQDVSLEVLPAEIHALVGENGAGKSTLVKIMTGAETPDAGKVTILGEEIGALTPGKARARGIGVVYQEPSLVPGLTVLESMFLGGELRRRVGVLERKAMRRKAQDALDTVGAKIRLGSDVSALSVAERQLVEIARALLFNARVLILDEPSAILSGPDLDRVFSVIKDVRATGLGVLYISHRLAEIFQLADRATVLKDGRLVATRSVGNLTTGELIRLMVGRDVGTRPPRKPPREDVVLEVRELQLRPRSAPVSFKLRAGEVLGVAGDAAQAGIVVIPEDRKQEGLIFAHSLRENIALAHLSELSRAGVMRSAEERRLAVEAVRRFGIRPPLIEVSVGALSGGNQQKSVLSKWLVMEPAPEVVILDEPTRGVDVGAKFEIYRLIDELLGGGAGVLLISSELPEVIAMSDRIIVMRAGAIAGVLKPGEFSEETILRLAVLGEGSEAGPVNGKAPAELTADQGVREA